MNLNASCIRVTSTGTYLRSYIAMQKIALGKGNTITGVPVNLLKDEALVAACLAVLDKSAKSFRGHVEIRSRL